MTIQHGAFRSTLRASLLLLLLIGVCLVARTWKFAEPVLAASQRIVAVVITNSTDFFGLTLICIGAGIFVLSDRRRRARGRQAAS